MALARFLGISFLPLPLEWEWKSRKRKLFDVHNSSHSDFQNHALFELPSTTSVRASFWMRCLVMRPFVQREVLLDVKLKIKKSIPNDVVPPFRPRIVMMRLKKSAS